jgi:RNA polymerase sigma factor (sigma-70 family)
MKIQYQFADKTVEIEVSDEWGNILIDLDRQEYNNNHKETRRHYHFEACVYEGENFAVEDPALAALFESDETVVVALDKLPPKQRQIIKAVFFDHMTQSEYAHKHGLAKATVSIAYNRALKKLREIL